MTSKKLDASENNDLKKKKKNQYASVSILFFIMLKNRAMERVVYMYGTYPL